MDAVFIRDVVQQDFCCGAPLPARLPDGKEGDFRQDR